MKVICDRGALLSAINLVSGVVAQRTPRPQLQCVKLTGKKTGKVGELTLSATDAEVSLRLKLSQVDVQQPGEALIPADPLRQIISAEEHEPTLTIEAEQDACHIKGADAHFKVFGYPPAEFPPIPEFDKVVSGSGEGKARAVLSLPAGTLLSMITRTLFATARENSRYAINGVLLKREGKKLEMVATDGRRLAMVRQNVPAEKDAATISCIIPTKALSMLQKLIDDPDDTVQIAVTDSQVLFSIGGKDDAGRAVLVSNLVEGAFPPYEDVIPRDQDKKIVFDRDVLMSAVRRAALLTNEESRGVRMRFNAADKQVELSSRAPEKGESEIKAEIASYEGDNLEIGFNPQFISDALKVISETEIILELKDAKRPGMMKSGSDFLYVVMPVNLQ